MYNYIPELSRRSAAGTSREGSMRFLSALTSLAVVYVCNAHGSGAWLDLQHHNSKSRYSGMRVRKSL